MTIKSEALRGCRRVLEGRFKLSGSNTLTYHVKTPIPAGIKAPHQVKLHGAWSLTEDHDLRLTLDKWQRKTFGDQVTIQAEIIDVRKNSLAFAVQTKKQNDLPSFYTLELAGSWQADERNRLTFRVNRGAGRFDSLTFDAAWQLDKNYKLTYAYQKEGLVRRTKKTHTLTFDGYWDIRDKTRLSYVLAGAPASGFDFTATAGIFKSNYIKYELGIGLSRKRLPQRRVITFPGKWMIQKDLGFVFEVRRENRKFQTFIFGAEARLKGRDSVAVSLRSSLNRDLAAEVELSRDIFNADGQAFLRLLASKKEAAVVAGAGFRW
ncbi:MAG: hypothetical protein PHT59_05230 [Candidatus Omnitrophica bacterium]|nr:hypothetical protein [Candidatus Omnitrophota bacterium]